MLIKIIIVNLMHCINKILMGVVMLIVAVVFFMVFMLFIGYGIIAGSMVRRLPDDEAKELHRRALMNVNRLH